MVKQKLGHLWGQRFQKEHNSLPKRGTLVGRAPASTRIRCHDQERPVLCGSKSEGPVGSRLPILGVGICSLEEALLPEMTSFSSGRST